MNILKMIFGRKKVVVDIQTQEDAAELQQAMARNALQNSALAATQQALKIGALTNTQAASITVHMKSNPSLRTILEELIETLEANGEAEHATLVREIDTELFKGCVSPAPPDPEEARKRRVVETMVRENTTKVTPKFREQVVQETMARFDSFIGQRVITMPEIETFIKLESTRPGLDELITTGRLKEYAAAKQRAIDMEADQTMIEEAERLHHICAGLKELYDRTLKNPAVLSGDIAAGIPELLHIDEYVKELKNMQDDTSCRFPDCSKFIHATHGQPRLEQALGKEAAHKILQDAYDAQRTEAATLTITIPDTVNVSAKTVTVPIASRGSSRR